MSDLKLHQFTIETYLQTAGTATLPEISIVQGTANLSGSGGITQKQYHLKCLKNSFSYFLRCKDVTCMSETVQKSIYF